MSALQKVYAAAFVGALGLGAALVVSAGAGLALLMVATHADEALVDLDDQLEAWFGTGQ